MKTFLALSVAALLLLTACSQQQPAEGIDLTVVIGERAGAITAATTRADLVALYGAERIAEVEYPIGEGETGPATVIFPQTPREATVIWTPDQAGAAVDRVVIAGRDWVLPEGLRPGDGLETVEKLNGGPFMIYGFGWDYGGVGYFKGGTLDRKVQVWFRPSVEEGPAYQAVLGDSLFNSSDAAMRQADPRVAKVAIVFAPRES
jgi:hypothetical protein